MRVLDAFTRGGAQQAGVRDVLEFEAATDLDYVRGRHSFRAGVLLEGGRYRSSDEVNYLGTYTFASLERLRRRPAGELHAAHRRSGDSVQQRPGWRVLARTTSGSRKSLMLSATACATRRRR